MTLVQSDSDPGKAEELGFRPEAGATAAPLGTRRFRSWPDILLMGGLMAVVVAVQGRNITGYPELSDDEGTYLAQAWAIQHGQGLTHYTYWYDHPPGGWIQLAALSWLPALLHEAPAAASGRLIMLVVTAINVMLVYALGRRLGLRRWAATLAVVLFGLSPLSVTLQRQVYLDSIAVAWMLGAFLLALSWRRHLWHHLAAGACAAVSVLSKETMVIVLPALVATLWQHGHQSTRRFSLAGFLSALVLIGFVYPLFAALKGELLPGRGHVSLLSAFGFQLHGRKGSGQILDPHSPAADLVRYWTSRDAILLYAGLVAVAVALALTKHPAWRMLRPPSLAAALLIAVALRPGGYLPAMYVLQVLPFLALTVAGMLEIVVIWVWRQRLSSRSVEGWIRRPLAVTVLLLTVAPVVPLWYRGDQRAITDHANVAYAAAARWIRAGGIPDPAHTTIVLDDVLWLDAVDAGFQPGRGAIWFQKVQASNGVPTTIRSWREIHYVISSRALRQAAGDIPNVRAALEHSQAIKIFGTGAGRIEIRKLSPGAGQ